MLAPLPTSLTVRRMQPCRVRTLLRVVLPLTMLASCSSAASSPDVSSFVRSVSSSAWRADEAQTALSYRPDPDGLSFGNYQMTDASSFTIDDAAALLKDAVCAEGVSGCVPSASAVEWVESVRAALQGGLCEGFSLLSMNSYLSADSTSAFALPKSKDTERTLSRLFATQFMPEVRTAARSWRDRSLKEIVAELTRALSTKSDMYTIGLYSASGGHAIVPYAINEVAPGMFVVSVYDSNWPGRDRFLEVDTNNDTWRFSYKAEDQLTDTEAWSGKSGSMDITPFAARTGKFSSPFDKTGKTSTMTLTVSATDTSWSVSQAGNILASALTVSKDDEVRGAFGVRTVVLDVPSGQIAVKLPGGPKNTASRVSIASSSSVVSVQAASSDVEVEFNVGSKLTAKVTGEASIAAVAAQSRVTLSSSNTAEVTSSPSGETIAHTVDKEGLKHDVSLPPSLLRRDAVVVADNVEITNPQAIELPARTLSEDMKARRKLDPQPSTSQTSAPTTTSSTSTSSTTTTTTSIPTPPTSRPPLTTSPKTTSPKTTSPKTTSPKTTTPRTTASPSNSPTTVKSPPQDCRSIDPTQGLDTDRDGLPDELELCVRTDPQRRDTDADGLTDADEVLACLYPKPGPGRCSNPTKPDSDSDGLTDPEELRIGTNPNVADTDQDGIPDGVELSHGLNPLNRDSNNDGVPDSL
jgi:hypothetical protein